MRVRSRLMIFLYAGSFSVAAQETQPAATPVAPAAATQGLEKPLPNLEALLDRAKSSSDAMLELRKNYTYKETKVADEFDSKGNNKGRHTDEYQIFYVEKTQLQQHIAHDGKPLSDGDGKKEQERVDKQVAEIKAHTQRKDPHAMVLRVSTLIKLATVSAPRREMRNGRSTIIFDYKGNLRSKADGIFEEMIKKLEGTIEVDEHDAAIVHLTGTLQENFRVLGGLAANIQKGSHFEMNAARINDEVWFTKSFAAHVDGHILVFKGFDGDMHTTFSDYRKMRTSVTLLPGSQVIGEDGVPIPNLEAEPEPAPAFGIPKP